MSQFGKEFDRKLDKHIIGNYGENQFEEEEDFADNRVVNMLIKDFQKEIKRLDNVIKTQNNLIDNLRISEKNNMDNINCLRKENGKLLKYIKINNVNVHLLKMRLDNFDKFIQNILIKQNN